MRDTRLEIRGLSGGYERGVNIVEDICLTVPTGEAVGVIGLNGSGKSTLAKALVNLLPYRSGSIFFAGEDVTQKRTHELARKGIALMHQGGTVFPNLTVRENLRFAYGSCWTQHTPGKLAGIFPLFSTPGKLRIMADKLSGGERHELALAMTLAREPRLLILDEPSAGLSPAEVTRIYTILSDLRAASGQSIILIEQNVTRAAAFCDRCVLMETGHATDLGKKNIKDLETILFNNR